MEEICYPRSFICHRMSNSCLRCVHMCELASIYVATYLCIYLSLYLNLYTFLFHSIIRNNTYEIQLENKEGKNSSSTPSILIGHDLNHPCQICTLEASSTLLWPPLHGSYLRRLNSRKMAYLPSLWSCRTSLTFPSQYEICSRVGWEDKPVRF